MVAIFPITLGNGIGLVGDVLVAVRLASIRDLCGGFNVKYGVGGGRKNRESGQAERKEMHGFCS
jgi:hypothetical protein